jgi:glycosyltransferase involved in cell wall biosynthesis
MSSIQPSFCLLIPTLNEINGLRKILPQLDRSLCKEIIVVDGGSTDGTIEFCREQGLTVLRQLNHGLPDAEEYAFQYITADAMILFTPDGNSLPELLAPLCNKLSEGYDMVIVSRYLGGAKSEDDDTFTGFGNWMFTWMINLLFGGCYTDTLVGFRAYTTNAIRQMDLPGMVQKSRLRQRYWWLNSWEAGSSIRAARLNLKVTEIPGDEPKRIGGVRKMTVIRNGFGTLFQILYDFFFFHPPPSN